MEKSFEDYFSEYQADMVSICLEYASDRADMIYICCACEGSATTAEYFYRINGKVVNRGQLNDAINLKTSGFRYDTSTDVQRQTLRIILDDIADINKLCKKYDRPMPTEMKLIYDVKRNKLSVSYRYDLVYSHTKDKYATDVVEEWFEEIKKEKVT